MIGATRASRARAAAQAAATTASAGARRPAFQARTSSVASMAICVVLVVITLVDATRRIRIRTVALCVPMAKRPSRLATTTTAAFGSESGAPISTAARNPVSTAHSSPKAQAIAARPRRSTSTASAVVTTAAKRNTGIASTLVTAPCSLVTKATAASTKLPVTCATNNPNSASAVQASTKPAVKPSSGGIATGTGRGAGRKASLMHPSALEPRRDPLHRLVHVGGRSGVAEADEMSALQRIEIDPRRCRHVSFRQHALGEIKAVVGEARHVGIEIEGPVHREKLLEPRLRQAGEQDAAVLLVAVLDVLHLGTALECRLGRNLRQRRDRDREIALQAIDRTQERLRHHHPSDAPAGHAEIFRERVDDHGIVGHARGGFRREGVVEAVIDLVR